MIDPRDFCLNLSNSGINFFAGVPDSLLIDICSFVDHNFPKTNHQITANEGSAVGLGIGYFLATQKIPLIYMQNSGLGNATNPLISLADRKVYSIPMILMIGWRGQPEVSDEPQHLKQGLITKDLLRVMDIPFKIFSKDTNRSSMEEELSELVKCCSDHRAPVALLIKKGTFNPYKPNKKKNDSNLMSRHEVLDFLVNQVGSKSIIVSTTGVTSRELLELRIKYKQDTAGDFLTVGGMGHASQIALGISMQKKNKEVACLDGDGALLMHMGSLASIADSGCKNYKYILLNNMVHDSVGGQPIAAKNINFSGIAKASGFKKVFTISELKELEQLKVILKQDGPTFIEIKIRPGFKEDLIRPSKTPVENKDALIKFINTD